MKQLRFGFLGDYKKEFGGSLLLGRRKSKRPISTKNPMHLIMKASGKRFFRPHNRSLEKLIHREAAKYGVKVWRISLNWTHIHSLIQVRSREAYNRFIRSLTSKISIAICKRVGSLKEGLFDLRPFTRILEWGKDFNNVIEYHALNDLEARGHLKRPKCPLFQGSCRVS